MSVLFFAEVGPRLCAAAAAGSVVLDGPTSGGDRWRGGGTQGPPAGAGAGTAGASDAPVAQGRGVGGVAQPHGPAGRLPGQVCLINVPMHNFHFHSLVFSHRRWGRDMQQC